MALLTDTRWKFWFAKPITARGTAKAFAAGDAMFKRTGINPHLKAAVKRSIVNDKNRAR
jgi:hypothetical protein